MKLENKIESYCYNQPHAIILGGGDVSSRDLSNICHLEPTLNRGLLHVHNFNAGNIKWQKKAMFNTRAICMANEETFNTILNNLQF